MPATTLLAIFAHLAEDTHPNWQHVSKVLQHINSVSVSVYTSKSPTSFSSSRLVVLLCVLGVPTMEIGDKMSMISSDLMPIMGTVPELRLYRPLTSGRIMDVHKADHFLVMNAMTPHPNFEKGFHDWYIAEHIPLLRRVPFWHSSERFSALTSSSINIAQVPRYLALHRWDDIAAFGTDEYKAATNTPWRTEVIGNVVHKERLVLKYEGELEDLRFDMSNTSLPKAFIDLTQTLSESTVPIAPGFPPYTCRPLATVPKDGYSVHAVSFGSHIGTHIDAPSHFVAGGKTVEQIPLSTLVGPAVIVDLTRRSEPLRERQVIVWSDIEPYAKKMREGVILLLYTGWSQYWDTTKYFAHPYLSRDAAERIVETGVRVLGVDMMSPDETPRDGVGSLDGFGVHSTILGAGGVLAENLTNLQALANSEQNIVSLVPLSLAGCDGSPIRAFAWKF